MVSEVTNNQEQLLSSAADIDEHSQNYDDILLLLRFGKNSTSQQTELDSDQVKEGQPGFENLSLRNSCSFTSCCSSSRRKTTFSSDPVEQTAISESIIRDTNYYVTLFQNFFDNSFP